MSVKVCRKQVRINMCKQKNVQLLLRLYVGLRGAEVYLSKN